MRIYSMMFFLILSLYGSCLSGIYTDNMTNVKIAFDKKQNFFSKTIQNSQKLALENTQKDYNVVLEFARQRNIIPKEIKYFPKKKGFLLIDTNGKKYFIE